MKRLGSTIAKKILGIGLIIWCSGVFFNGYVGTNDVYAQAQTQWWTITDENSQTMDTMSIRQILNMVLKIIYLLLWPLLVVAGLALDNTLVYASIFHLDAPLWKFWNMMKNFANFGLWFMVLFAIIKSILTNNGGWSIKDEKSPLGIIKTTLIAGILIQASWFLVAAVIDVSTIATYAVGGLPLSVLKKTTIGDQKILSVNSQLDLNKFEITSAWGKEFQVWYSTKHPGIQDANKTVTISPCRVERSYVIWREYGDIKYKNTEKLSSITEDGSKPYEGLEVCVLYGNQLVMRPEEKFMQEIKDIVATTVTWTIPEYTTEAWYTYYMDALLNITWWDTQSYVTGNLVYLGSWTSAFTMGNTFFSGTDSLTIASLIQKSKWFVGPLVTIYSSLLNFAQLSNTNITTTSWTSGIFIIKSLVAIALFFPLIALALVLILRIWVLWLYIVASPFIILKASFKNFLSIKGLDDYLSIKAVMGIIFAPVVTVAALSISLIFMTALSNGFTSHDTSSAINETLGITKLNDAQAGNDAISIGWVAQLEFSKLPWWEAMDRFSRLIVNFFGIGLMWMIVFAAIKANKIGEKVGQKVQDFGETTFRTLPILPTGWWDRIGIGSLGSVLGGTPQRWVNKLESNAEKTATKLIDKIDGNTNTIEWTKTLLDTEINSTLNQLTSPNYNKDRVISHLETLDTTPTNFWTVNSAALYAAINTATTSMDATQKAQLIANTNEVFGNGWYANQAIAQARANIDSKVTNKITDSSTPEQIQALIGSPETKPFLDTYFTYMETPYTLTTPSGKKKITISKLTNNTQAYTWVITDIV